MESIDHKALTDGGFFRLFNLVGIEYRPEILRELGVRMATTSTRGFGPSSIPAGYTYLGQFLVHDISRLANADRPSGRPRRIDELHQLRTPRLDLDSVYGEGWDDYSIGLDTCTGKFRIRDTVLNGEPARPLDLPRQKSGVAAIGDSRNDENLLISQLHVQFLRLHNYFVDKCSLPAGASAEDRFDWARSELIRIYRHVIAYDFLERLMDERTWEYVFVTSSKDGRARIWQPGPMEMLNIPLELSVAALRFGHSMVRKRYTINRANGRDKDIDLHEMFQWTGSRNLGHGARLPDDLVVDWEHFFQFPQLDPPLNAAEKVSPWFPLFRNEASNAMSRLAVDNLLRGNEVRLPDGQSLIKEIWRLYPHIAKEIKLHVIPPDTLNDEPAPGKGRIFDRLEHKEEISRKTPLLPYILLEAKLLNKGERLGPLGSLIVGESLRVLIERDGPLEDPAQRGEFRMGEILAYLS
ncbi:MAG: peroxidase family protein [Pseudomonadota bacterium]